MPAMYAFSGAAARLRGWPEGLRRVAEGSWNGEPTGRSSGMLRM